MQTTFKNIFDYLISLFLIPFSLFIIIIAASWIMIVSQGSPLFIQWRVGLHNRPFRMFKLRTMNNTSSNSETFTSEMDNRIIYGGRFLRKFRIDELPQFFNVLNGTMSIVGPRPEQVKVVKEYQKKLKNYSDRHLVKPGITGLAQIEIGYVDNIDGARLKLLKDLKYVKTQSFCGDLKICMKTLNVLLFGKGAR